MDAERCAAVRVSILAVNPLVNLKMGFGFAFVRSMANVPVRRRKVVFEANPLNSRAWNFIPKEPLDFTSVLGEAEANLLHDAVPSFCQAS
jgi:hypothetical protein